MTLFFLMKKLKMSEQVTESANPFKKCANVECDNFVDADMSNLYCSQNCLIIHSQKIVSDIDKYKNDAFNKAVTTMTKTAQIGTRTLYQIATLEVQTEEGKIIKQLAVSAYNEITKLL